MKITTRLVASNTKIHIFRTPTCFLYVKLLIIAYTNRLTIPLVYHRAKRLFLIAIKAKAKQYLYSWYTLEHSNMLAFFLPHPLEATFFRKN